MTVEHAGFTKKVLDHVQIIPEQLNSLDVQLDLGQVETTVTVSGTTSALDTETATVSGTITSNQIQHMPSFNRDVFQLAQLAPGVFGDASQNGSGGSYTLPGAQGISGLFSWELAMPHESSEAPCSLARLQSLVLQDTEFTV